MHLRPSLTISGIILEEIIHQKNCSVIHLPLCQWDALNNVYTAFSHTTQSFLRCSTQIKFISAYSNLPYYDQLCDTQEPTVFYIINMTHAVTNLHASLKMQKIELDLRATAEGKK